MWGFSRCWCWRWLSLWSHWEVFALRWCFECRDRWLRSHDWFGQWNWRLRWFSFLWLCVLQLLCFFQSQSCFRLLRWWCNTQQHMCSYYWGTWPPPGCCLHIPSMFSSWHKDKFSIYLSWSFLMFYAALPRLVHSALWHTAKDFSGLLVSKLYVFPRTPHVLRFPGLFIPFWGTADGLNCWPGTPDTRNLGFCLGGECCWSRMWWPCRNQLQPRVRTYSWRLWCRWLADQLLLRWTCTRHKISVRPFFSS